MHTWTRWRPFPDPRKGQFLHAPIGPGLYELRNTRTGQLILVGIGANTAHRMSSLLPKSHAGAGGRNNTAKRAYVARHLTSIEYRTRPTQSRDQARDIERRRLKQHAYRFPT